jgi:hypothetical protein
LNFGRFTIIYWPNPAYFLRSSATGASCCIPMNHPSANNNGLEAVTRLKLELGMDFE